MRGEVYVQQGRGLRMNELPVKCLLYDDDQVILASCGCVHAEQLQGMITLMNEALKRKGMNVNVNQTNVMVF